MIFPIKYDINTTQTKDGKSIPIKIPGNEVLFKMGALLQVTVTHPQITAQNYINRGEQVPKCVAHAIIDTGASISIITPQIASQLNLVHTGYVKVTSVQDKQDRPVYYGAIIFPWNKVKQTQIASCPLQGFDCLIGRDVLMHWHFTYVGTEGMIFICD